MKLSKQLTLIKKLSSSYKSGISPIKFFKDYPQVVEALKKGEPLSEALKKDEDKILDDVYIKLIHIGEKSGKLENSFKLIIELMQGILRIQQEVFTSLRYPIAALGVYLFIFAVFLFWVIPGINGFMQEMETPVPLIISILVGVKNIVLFAVFGGILGVLYMFYEKKSLSVPILGYLNRQKDFYIYFYAMKACYASGLSILEASELATEAVTNENLKYKFIEIDNSLKNQGSLTSVYLDSELFNSEITDLIEAGEEAGTLEENFSEILRIIQEKITEKISFIVLLVKPLGVIFGLVFLIFIFLFIISFLSGAFSEINKALTL